MEAIDSLSYSEKDSGLLSDVTLQQLTCLATLIWIDDASLISKRITISHLVDSLTCEPILTNLKINCHALESFLRKLDSAIQLAQLPEYLYNAGFVRYNDDDVYFILDQTPWQNRKHREHFSGDAAAYYDVKCHLNLDTINDIQNVMESNLSFENKCVTVVGSGGGVEIRDHIGNQDHKRYFGLASRVKPEGHVTGIDYSIDMVRTARKQLEEYTNVTIEQDDCMSGLKSVPDASQDALIFTMSLHHMPDIKRAIDVARTKLKIGRMLFINDKHEFVFLPYVDSRPDMHSIQDMTDLRPGLNPELYLKPILHELGFSEVKIYMYREHFWLSHDMMDSLLGHRIRDRILNLPDSIQEDTILLEKHFQHAEIPYGRAFNKLNSHVFSQMTTQRPGKLPEDRTKVDLGVINTYGCFPIFTIAATRAC